ncbi:hypothetical protein D3C71_1786780 [compost metagenome]
MNSSQIKNSLVVFCCGAVLAGHAAAAGCVSKPVKLLVPYPAGGLSEGAEIGSPIRRPEQDAGHGPDPKPLRCRAHRRNRKKLPCLRQ